MAMERLFKLMAEKKASDLFIAVGSAVHMKVNGTSVPINQPDTEFFFEANDVG